MHGAHHLKVDEIIGAIRLTIGQGAEVRSARHMDRFQKATQDQRVQSPESLIHLIEQGADVSLLCDVRSHGDGFASRVDDLAGYGFDLFDSSRGGDNGRPRLAQTGPDWSPNWSRTGYQNGPTMVTKMVQKMVTKMGKKWSPQNLQKAMKECEE